jgi:hypothetical protein
MNSDDSSGGPRLWALSDVCKLKLLETSRLEHVKK